MQRAHAFVRLGVTAFLGLTVIAGSPRASQADSDVPSRAEPVASSGAEGSVTNFTLTNDMGFEITVKWLDAQANELPSYGGDLTEADPWIGPGEAWRVEGGAHTAESHWFAIHTQSGFRCSFSPREGAVVQFSQLPGCKGDIASRFTDHGNGTFTDSTTGLIWEQKVSGPEAGPGTCPVDLHAVYADCTWDMAMGDWINAINAEGGTGLGGHSDWRVPDVKELQSLTPSSAFTPAVKVILIPGHSADGPHWSSTPLADSASNALVVRFFDGEVDTDVKTHVGHVRAVRGAARD